MSLAADTPYLLIIAGMSPSRIGGFEATRRWDGGQDFTNGEVSGFWPLCWASPLCCARLGGGSGSSCFDLVVGLTCSSLKSSTGSVIHMRSRLAIGLDYANRRAF